MRPSRQGVALPHPPAAAGRPRGKSGSYTGLSGRGKEGAATRTLGSEDGCALDRVGRGLSAGDGRLRRGWPGGPALGRDVGIALGGEVGSSLGTDDGTDLGFTLPRGCRRSRTGCTARFRAWLNAQRRPGFHAGRLTRFIQAGRVGLVSAWGVEGPALGAPLGFALGFMLGEDVGSTLGTSPGTCESNHSSWERRKGRSFGRVMGSRSALRLARMRWHRT